jgi:DNA-binding transcriptional MerR regulator
MSDQSTDLLPRRLVAERYGVNPRTIVRWENDPNLRFPQPLTINNRQYYHEAELTMFDRTRRPTSSAA